MFWILIDEYMMLILFFSEVSFIDTGIYTCIATNNYGTANASRTLTVKGRYII